jgi:hypothetical protein
MHRVIPIPQSMMLGSKQSADDAVYVAPTEQMCSCDRTSQAGICISDLGKIANSCMKEVMMCSECNSMI